MVSLKNPILIRDENMNMYVTFSDELDIIKRIESLGGIIHVRIPCCCDEEFKVNWWGHIPINNLNLTIDEAINISTTIGNYIGTECFPVIKPNGIGIKFNFYTIVNEEYPSEQFDLFTHYL